MRKYFLCAAVGALMLSLAACADTPAKIEETVGTSISSEPTEEAFDLNAYALKAEKLNDEIAQNSIALGNLGKWEVNYMTALGKTSDDMLERGYAWLEEKSDYTQETVEEANDSILKIYTELQMEIRGHEADYILEQIEALYGGYSNLYNTVTTKQQSVENFQIELNKSLKDISKYSDLLQAGCDNILGNSVTDTESKPK